MEKLSIKNILYFILGLQLILFLVTVLIDVEYRWLRYFDEKELQTGPVQPGDQRRIYDPKDVKPDVFPSETKHNFQFPKDMPERLRFSIENSPKDGPVLLVYGAIENGDFNRFVEFFQRQARPPRKIAFSSPGGSVREALELGRFVRDNKINTIMLPGMYCFSACPYMFGAGVKRKVYSSAALGMHQHYYDESVILPAFLAVEDIQINQGVTMQYLIDMGIDPSLMLYSLNTPPDEIYILIESELLDTKLATEISR